MPPFNDLIKMVIRSSQPPLCDQLTTYIIPDFNELKIVGERIDRIRLRMKRPRIDPLRLQLGPPSRQSNVNPEPEPYCVYHRTVGHPTEYCVDLKTILNARTSEMDLNREPQKPRSPDSVNVFTNLDLVIDPETTIQPIEEPEPDLPINEVQENEHPITNPILDLDLDDEELSADCFENYDMHGRFYINKKLQKKSPLMREYEKGGKIPSCQHIKSHGWSGSPRCESQNTKY